MDLDGGESSDAQRPADGTETGSEGRDHTARAYQEEMRLLAAAIMRGDKEGGISHLITTADCLVEDGQLERAEALIRNCIELAVPQEQGEAEMCKLYYKLGYILLCRKSFAESERWLQAAYTLADETPLNLFMSFAIALQMARLLGEQERAAEAATWKRRADSLWDGLRQWLERKRRGLPE